MGTKPRKAGTPPEPSSTPSEPELPERWSVQRKSELVLRLLRGEALDAVSRESQVPAHELESWGTRSARRPQFIVFGPPARRTTRRGVPPLWNYRVRERRLYGILWSSRDHHGHPSRHPSSLTGFSLSGVRDRPGELLEPADGAATFPRHLWDDVHGPQAQRRLDAESIVPAA
jgi:hypothetical protein